MSNNSFGYNYWWMESVLAPHGGSRTCAARAGCAARAARVPHSTCRTCAAHAPGGPGARGRGRSEVGPRRVFRKVPKLLPRVSPGLILESYKSKTLILESYESKRPSLRGRPRSQGTSPSLRGRPQASRDVPQPPGDVPEGTKNTISATNGVATPPFGPIPWEMEATGLRMPGDPKTPQ